MTSPIRNVALRYLDSINDTPTKLPLRPSNNYNKKSSDEDLDKLALQININSDLTPKLELLRTKFETPSVTVSSFKTPLNFSSSNTSSRSGSPIKRNYKSFGTPKIPSLKNDLNKYDDKPYLSSPSNSESKDSPGYEYLCRIMAIKNWLEHILNEEIDKSPLELISDIRNGIILAKLANVILPTKRQVFTSPKLQFRHTENINRFFKLTEFMSVPDLFTFELTDLYDAKNIPKVWFCLHAMSYMLHKSDSSNPQIESLVGKVDFTPEDIRSANKSLAGTGLPNFASADNDNPNSGESSYMNRALSPSKFISPKKITKTNTFESNENLYKVDRPLKPVLYDTPKTPAKNLEKPELYTPHSQIIKRPNLDDVDYMESKYYTPEIDQHIVNIIKLQALSRAASFRYGMFVDKIMLRSYSDELTMLFSIIRGRLSRRRTVDKHKDEIMLFRFEIIELQSIARTKLQIQRKVNLSQYSNIKDIQSKIRGNILRVRCNTVQFGLLKHESVIIQLQAHIKRNLVYSKTAKLLNNKEAIEIPILELQSIIRRVLYEKNKTNILIMNLRNHGGLIDLQGLIRGKALRDEYFSKLYVLYKQRKRLTLLQAVARGGLTRTRLCNNVLITLMEEDIAMNQLFGKARGNLVRRNINYTKYHLYKEEENIIKVQSRFRGILERFKRDILIEDIYDNVYWIKQFQSIIRGKNLRIELNSIDAYYYENINKLIKVQCFIKSNFAQRAYKSLITRRNPPLSIIRKFAYLLSDNDMDYEQEMELAELKDKIIEKSKANEELETLIENLDIKLGLLDKNKISLEDFIKNKFQITTKVHETNLEKLNKSSRERMEHYQSLFYLLQTKPIYFIRLHESIDLSIKDSVEVKNLQKFILLMYPIKDSSIMFHSREEFFLLRFIMKLMTSDMKQCNSLTDITKASNCFWISYSNHFNSHTYQRIHLKGILGKFVDMVIDDEELDFESDPVKIHQQFIDKDMKTNGFSERDASATAAVAIKIPEVSNKFINNLMSLREYSAMILDTLHLSVTNIPLHVKLIAKHGYGLSRSTFPDRSEHHHLSVAGVIFIKHYIGHILQYPENFGFIINQFHHSSSRIINLQQLHKVLMQMFSLKMFNDNFLKPLNDYISNSLDTVRTIIKRLIDVDDIENEYKLNDYNDIVTHERPKLTMKVTDMVQIEKIVQNNLDTIAPSSDDQLYVIASALNSEINSADDLASLSELGMVTLSLNPTTKEESIADSKGNVLFTQAKRSVLYIIRVQKGDDLLELLISGIKPYHEQNFKDITQSEIKDSPLSKKRAYHKISLGDLTKISYHELKKNALEAILQLESMGLVTRRDSYQTILNQIAHDIKTKHQQRISRKTQLEIAQRTNQKLLEKELVLKRQHQDYNSHIDNILSELQLRPKDKKIFNVIPIFSKQYFYHRELKKSNRLPKFGSYKYSAKKLIEQKIIVDFGGALNSRFNNSSKLDFMFSCHQAGKFIIEAANGSISIPGAYGSISLDELLNLQYENKSVYEGFDGMVIFDTMNLTSFIFKKFYDLKKD